MRQLWARAHEEQRQISEQRADELVKNRFAILEKELESLKPEEHAVAPVPEPVPAGTAGRVQTGVPVQRLREINDALLTRPEGFTVHKKLERVREKRRVALANPAERSIDWAVAEELAFATILAEGVPIRLTGEDVERGTFSHRHAVFHDIHSGRQLIPLQEFAQARAPFEIHNSPLSENAAVGFEFGYMGAWQFVRPLLEELVGTRRPLRYIGRARSSSPSEGSAAWHRINQTALVEQAFDSQRQAPEATMVLSKQV